MHRLCHSAFSRQVRNSAIFETRPKHMDKTDRPVELEYKTHTPRLFENTQRSDLQKMKREVQSNITERTKRMRESRTQKRQ